MVLRGRLELEAQGDVEAALALLEPISQLLEDRQNTNRGAKKTPCRYITAPRLGNYCSVSWQFEF
jgi:hypothetical protein